MNARQLVVAAAATLALAGCSALKNPEQRSAKVVFPHSKHLGFGCTDCHDAIQKQAKVAWDQLPTAAKCGDCHDTAKEPAVAAAAAGLRKPADFKDSKITFSHADHLPKVNNKCEGCHQVLSDPAQKSSATPPMATCTACHHHSEEFAQARCQPCHVDLKSYPLKPVSAFAHVGNFRKDHAQYARNSAATCAVCHDQTYCAQCHSTETRPMKPSLIFPEKVQADFIHRGDYVSRHQIEASADPASCRRCHGSGFCQSCHEEQRLSSGKNLGQAGTRNPHPRGWVTRGSGEFHGTAARNNIVACAACHDQGAASICATCHRVGGIGGNPHPAGYSSQHPASDIAKTPMCRVCHTSGT
ncbi:cytochrome c3 family protein [Anaeromyxobacter paludicola]|uniref:Cytochrome c7-like domain-containing protein n=1 Tax=Anaeromyxobacter paludicola TaxID=2918171 RepID=A0ABM7XFD7_9BACT|nr:cytochrome c3 family protein [Anaeromyxobacter paludicola]BDG10585.1 hypothetical protein AMPC_36980 [Anaeromyxobacter paludicola]